MAVIVTVPAPEKSVGSVLPKQAFIAFARGCPEQKKKSLFPVSAICFAAEKLAHKSNAYKVDVLSVK